MIGVLGLKTDSTLRLLYQWSDADRQKRLMNLEAKRAIRISLCFREFSSTSCRPDLFLDSS